MGGEQGAKGRKVVAAERKFLISQDFSAAFFPNKELGKNPIHVSLSMKYSLAGDSEMTVGLSLCYEQTLDEVANCSQGLSHMVGHIYSLGIAMTCGEFSNILLFTGCTHLASY